MTQVKNTHVATVEDQEDQINDHVSFVKQCIAKGSILNGVEPKVLDGKGIGLVTNREVKQGELLMFVPTQILLTIDSQLFEGQAKLLDGLTVQGQLAALLVFPPLLRNEENSIQKFWLSVLPSIKDLKQAMPSFWSVIRDIDAVSSRMQETSPALKKFAVKQGTKCQADVEMARRRLLPFCAKELSVSLEHAEEQYEWGWLLVNTRSFFYDLAKKDRRHSYKRRKLSKMPPPSAPPSEECMALCPVIDYLNHAEEEGCEVGYNTEGYNVRASRDHEVGEELTISYGKQGNDYLLVEYGFTLADSPSDLFNIDHILLPHLSENQKEVLQDRNMLGDYTLSSAGEPCHRTACALRTRVFKNPKQWVMYMEGTLDEDQGRREASRLLHADLKSYLTVMEEEYLSKTTRKMNTAPDGKRSQEDPGYQDLLQHILIQRREEVLMILKRAIHLQG